MVYENLIAYYPFTGNALDRSGNSYDGVVTSASLTTDRSGNSNSAYLLDNIDVRNKIYAPDTAALFEVGDLSFSIWCKPANKLNSQYILNHYNWSFTITIVDSDLKYRFGVGRMNSGSGPFYSIYSSSSNYYPVNDEWVNLVGVYHPDSVGGSGYIKFYINGILQGTENIGSDVIYTGYGSDNLEWGNSAHGAAVPFEGSVDETYIFDKVLSDKEVKQLFNDNISIRKDLKVFAQEFVEPQSIPIVRDYAIASKTNGAYSGIGADFITNGGGEIDVSAFEEIDETLGNFAVEGEVYTSNASIYPTTFKYTYVNNDRGVNGVFATVTGSWVAGWNKVYFKPRSYSSLGNIPWNTMNRLEIYRSGGVSAVADFGIKNLCLIKFEDNKDIDYNLQLMKNGSVECKEINEYDVVTKTSFTKQGEIKTGEILEV